MFIIANQKNRNIKNNIIIYDDLEREKSKEALL